MTATSRPPWQTVARRMLVATPWLTVARDTVIQPDGQNGTYDHVVLPGTATVLAVDTDDTVPVTRQWIYTHGGAQWRLPAGGVKHGDPARTARDELAEETGVTADRWDLLGRVHGADSTTNHVDTVFLARDLHRGGPQRLEAGEADLEVHWLPFELLLAMVLAGEVPHAGSAFAVLAYAARRGSVT